MKLLAQVAAIAVLALAAADASASFMCFSAVPGVIDSTSFGSPGVYQYNYNVYGGTGRPCQGQLIDPSQEGGTLVDFYIPYFSDMGITNISVSTSSGLSAIPSSWTHFFEPNNDLFKIGGGVLHFINSTPPTTPSLVFGTSDFAVDVLRISYDAAFGATKGPFAVTVDDYSTLAQRTIFGDPAIPGSPMTIAALTPTALPPADVPEPGSIALLGLGLLGFAASRRKSAKIKNA